jgi:hypothetical protein
MSVSLASYLDPSDFAEAAIATARAGSLEGLSTDLRIIRLCCAVRDGDGETVRQVADALAADGVEGHALFKLRTAQLWLAIEGGDPTEVEAALVRWQQGRENWPGNWNDAVLDAPELGDHAQSLPKPPPPPRRRVTMTELTFVHDLSFCMTRAVQDNLQWLRPAAPGAGIADLVDAYRLVAVDLELREATLDGRGTLPDPTIALDDRGRYAGSFIVHRCRPVAGRGRQGSLTVIPVHFAMNAH